MKSQFFFLCGAPHKKKNWLFFGEAGAGERGAILYTVIESCRRRGIDPYAYLKDVLTRLPSMTNRQLVVSVRRSTESVRLSTWFPRVEGAETLKG